ncbi:MAG: hypothetical protein ICV83_16005 [Cytophagales bacterium]|nr:hypothetical protein [Cytophagales bacterium]
MKKLSRKAAFGLLFGLAASLTACHDETTASIQTTGRYNPTRGASPATVSQTSQAIEAITCALGCCSKKKANIANNQ